MILVASFSGQFIKSLFTSRVGRGYRRTEACAHPWQRMLPPARQSATASSEPGHASPLTMNRARQRCLCHTASRSPAHDNCTRPCCSVLSQRSSRATASVCRPLPSLLSIRWQIPRQSTAPTPLTKRERTSVHGTGSESCPLVYRPTQRPTYIHRGPYKIHDPVSEHAQPIRTPVTTTYVWCSVTPEYFGMWWRGLCSVNGLHQARIVKLGPCFTAR